MFGDISKKLTEVEFKNLTRVIKDVFFFAKFIYVVHPVRGKVQFNLYPFQIKVLWYFLTKRFNIVLKFRQAGITELISMYCLWLSMYHPNKNIQIISIKDRVAKKVLRKIKYMYKNLPDYLQMPVINGRSSDIGTAFELEFANGSLITSIPTTEDAGRSEGVSLLVIDEAAIIRWANRIWASAFPTLSTGGSAILNSCVTGDTMIIGKSSSFRIDTVCPKEFGKMDISALGLEVLSHTGKWQKVLGSVNKGRLETWEVQNKFGDTLKCTPNHKLLTSNGWKSTKEIIVGNLNIITYDSGINNLESFPITLPPKIEVLKPIPGFPNYQISNLGKVFISKNGGLVEKEPRVSRLNAKGQKYYAVSLWVNCKKKKRAIHNLVAEIFIGSIPEGYVVDHINCNPEDNYVTNLQIITLSANAKRATLYSRGITLGCKIGKGFANIQLIAKIREENLKGKSRSYIADKYGIPRSYITRTLNNTRVAGVQISKLTLIRKYISAIYDICVERDESYITDSKFINHNTPYGIGNFFHQTWVDACSGGNNFTPLRLKWPMHPERDQDWYDMMRQSLGPRRTAQEIDGDFLSSGDTVFDLMDIKAIEDNIPDYELLDTRFNGNLRVYEQPRTGFHYFIGADVATGRARDYSAFSIMDRYGDEKVCFKGKMPVEQFAKILMEYGRKYNNARLAPEANDIGLAVVKLIQEAGYPNLFYTLQILKEKGESKPKQEKIPGWYTTAKNRPIIIDELETDIRLDAVNIKDPFFVQEAYTFIYDDRNKAIAMGKENKRGSDDDMFDESVYTDDAILAKAITNYIRKGKIYSAIVAPQ